MHASRSIGAARPACSGDAHGLTFRCRFGCWASISIRALRGRPRGTRRSLRLRAVDEQPHQAVLGPGCTRCRGACAASLHSLGKNFILMLGHFSLGTEMRSEGSSLIGGRGPIRLVDAGSRHLVGPSSGAKARWVVPRRPGPQLLSACRVVRFKRTVSYQRDRLPCGNVMSSPEFALCLGGSRASGGPGCR